MQATQQGNTSPQTPPGRRVYAVGDVHGRFDLLETLLERIESDAANHPGPDNVLVFLGDYVDRGPNSKAVIERLSRPAPRDFELICLKGNHEEMMLDFLEGVGESVVWLRNGGRETLKSYGVTEPNLYVSPITDSDVEEARQFMRTKIPGSHVDFLSTLDLMHVEGDYLLVHAGVRPGIALADQKEQDLIWIRREFLDSREDFGKVVIHGHSIARKPTLAANRIGIDTGAWRSDVLTCLVLDGEDQRFLST